MTRISKMCICSILLVCAAGRAVGQQPGAPRPAFSPYLNLNRSGTSPAINYYGIVRPQFQALSTFQSLEQQAAANRQAISDVGAVPATGLPTTGHTVAFLNTGGYFMTMNPGGQGSQGGFGFGTGLGSGFGGGGGGGFGGMNRLGSGQMIRNNGGSMGRPR